MRRSATQDPEASRLYASIGGRVQQARKRDGYGWSQKQLADQVGLTRSSVANIELGRQHAPIHTLWAIAQALGLELRSLVPTTADLGTPAEPGLPSSPPRDGRASEMLSKSGPGLKAFMSSVRTEVFNANTQPSDDRKKSDGAASRKRPASRSNRRGSGRQTPGDKG
ncbi:MAG: helix-turn-helix transcriptional regulator [bacterium]|nr:helix-turn-helix transcriptional regulator [bacterium]